jgi:hypothetical protein
MSVAPAIDENRIDEKVIIGEVVAGIIGKNEKPEVKA